LQLDKLGTASGFRREPDTVHRREARVPIPEPRLLLLYEAARRVADRCGVSLEEAKAALDRAFREYILVPFDSRGATVDDWECATIDCEHSSITRRGPNVTYTLAGVRVSREHLDDWMAQVAPIPDPPSDGTMLRESAEIQMTTPQPWRFLELYWYVRDVLGWLIDRNPKRFGRILTRAEVGAATRYNDPARKEHNPARTLLHAFQQGRLLGFRDGQSVPIEFWSTKSITDIRNDVDTRVRRTEVLVLWPETWKWGQAIVWAVWRDEALVAWYDQDNLCYAERVPDRIRAGLQPAGSEQDLRMILRSGWTTARVNKDSGNGVGPIAADQCPEWAGMPPSWSEDEITFDAGEMRRELPYISDDARPKRFTDTQRFQSRHSQHIRERWRREWTDRFAAKQRQIRRWISFVEIADACATAAAPTSISEEDEARSLACRRLVESMSRGEFEKNGRSWVLLLLPYLHASVPPHRLTREYFLAMVDAYGVTDFSNGSGLVRDHLWFCWLPSELCPEWFKRHLLTWPDEFNPQPQTPGAGPGGASRAGELRLYRMLSEPEKRGDAGAIRVTGQRMMTLS
jgi:hypothetical protein